MAALYKTWCRCRRGLRERHTSAHATAPLSRGRERTEPSSTVPLTTQLMHREAQQRKPNAAPPWAGLRRPVAAAASRRPPPSCTRPACAGCQPVCRPAACTGSPVQVETGSLAKLQAAWESPWVSWHALQGVADNDSAPVEGRKENLAGWRSRWSTCAALGLDEGRAALQPPQRRHARQLSNGGQGSGRPATGCTSLSRALCLLLLLMLGWARWKPPDAPRTLAALVALAPLLRASRSCRRRRPGSLAAWITCWRQPVPIFRIN